MLPRKQLGNIVADSTGITLLFNMNSKLPAERIAGFACHLFAGDRLHTVGARKTLWESDKNLPGRCALQVINYNDARRINSPYKQYYAEAGNKQHVVHKGSKAYQCSTVRIAAFACHLCGQ